MDRNLGAIITNYDGHDKKDPRKNKGIIGLYYQFGRKDPFQTVIITIPNKIEEQQSYAYTVNNPDTFIKFIGDWHTPSNTMYPWNGNSAVEKSIYDPCPSGWRVPEEELWSDFAKSNLKSDITYYGSVYKSGYKDIAWYPFAGSRHYELAQVSDVGGSGYNWSSSPRFDERGYDLYFYAPDVYPGMYDYRAYGFPVRCVQE